MVFNFLSIYQMILDDRTISEVADILNLQGIPSPRGTRWSYSTVHGILTNEKYCGDVLMQKTVTIDLFSHKSIRNDGRADQFYLQDYHDPIVSKDVWNEVQKILKGELPSVIPSLDAVTDMQDATPDILSDFCVVKPRKEFKK